MLKFIYVGLFSLGLIASAHAQAIGGNASIDVTTSTANIALPADTTQYPSVLLAPATGSTDEIFYKFGVDDTVAATTSSPALPANGICFQGFGSSNKFVAAIAGTGTPTLRITQFNGCPQIP